jgi:hypothetical protein
MSEVVYVPADISNPKGSKPLYTPNIFDWIINNGELITGFESSSNQTEILYTIPKNYVFYLISICMTCQNEAALASIPTCNIMLDGNPIFHITAGMIAGNATTNAISYSIPLRLTSGRILSQDSNRANCWIRTTWSGYLVPESLKPY